LLYSVCQHLDGAIFTPSALRDANGRILLSADSQTDPSAVMPQIPLDDSDAPNEDTSDENDFDPVPPTAERVARRALALAAVAARATLELDAPQLEDPEADRARLLEWLGSLDIGSELEPDEWKVLQRPVGGIERQDHINAMWRVEGLAVVAWALHLYELPPDDELVVPVDLYDSIGLFNVEKAREVLVSPNLRSAEELAATQTHLLMLHWRLRDFSIRPWAMDFVSFSKSCWVGSFDVSAYRIANNDLAIGSVAIADAEDDALRKVSSLALERHLAINWLMGYSEIYSQTDTST
jgi:hypothetical protein